MQLGDEFGDEVLKCSSQIQFIDEFGDEILKCSSETRFGSSDALISNWSEFPKFANLLRARH